MKVHARDPDRSNAARRHAFRDRREDFGRGEREQEPGSGWPSMAKALLLFLLIRTLRLYTVYAPWDKGRWWIASLLSACARHSPERGQMVIGSRDGRKFLIDPHEPQYHMDLLDRGLFEPEATAAVHRCLPQGAVVVDAGANFGWYTTLFSRLIGPDGTVHAFEPMPHTAKILRENCRLNGCRNVLINQSALGEREGEGTLYNQRGRACGEASFFASAQQQADPYPCRVTTLDKYFEEKRLGRCDFIKCDVEGAELMVLKGASKVLEAHRPTLLIEINPGTLDRAGCKGSDILEEIQRHGKYVFEVIDRVSGQHRLVQPADCNKLETYANVLCRPKSPV